ncbi:hypothetical protein V6Z11_1Z102100 [Gossypium hirsutum]
MNQQINSSGDIGEVWGTNDPFQGNFLEVCDVFSNP